MGERPSAKADKKLDRRKGPDETKPKSGDSVAVGVEKGKTAVGEAKDKLITADEAAKFLQQLSDLEAKFQRLELNFMKEIASRQGENKDDIDKLLERVEMAFGPDDVMRTLRVYLDSRLQSASSKSSSASVFDVDQAEAVTIEQVMNESFKKEILDLIKIMQKELAVIVVSYKKYKSSVRRQLDDESKKAEELIDGVLGKRKTAGAKDIFGALRPESRDDAKIRFAQILERDRESGSSISSREDFLREAADVYESEIKYFEGGHEKVEKDFSAVLRDLRTLKVEMRNAVSRETGYNVDSKFDAYYFMVALEGMLDSANNDPTIYAKIGPFLEPIIEFIHDTKGKLADIGKDDPAKKVKIFDDLNTHIKEHFRQVMINLGILPKLVMLNPQYEGKGMDDYSKMGQERVKDSERQAFYAEADGIFKLNDCLDHLIKKEELLDKETYRTHGSYRRAETMTVHEITFTYRELYNLYRANEDLTKSYLSARAKELGVSANVNKMWGLIEDKFEGTEERLENFTHPYFVYDDKGRGLYISKDAVNLDEGEGEGKTTISGDNFVRINDMPGIVVLNGKGQPEYVVADDDGNVTKHWLLPVTDPGQAREVIKNFGKIETTFYVDLMKTLGVISSTLGGITGVVTDFTSLGSAVSDAAVNNPIAQFSKRREADNLNDEISGLLIKKQNLVIKQDQLLAEGKTDEAKQVGARITSIDVQISIIEQRIARLGGGTVSNSPSTGGNNASTTASTSPSNVSTSPEAKTVLSQNIQNAKTWDELIIVMETYMKGVPFPESQVQAVKAKLLERKAADSSLAETKAGIIESVNSGAFEPGADM